MVTCRQKRNEIKKINMEPYGVAETQTKELIALIDAALKAIGACLDGAQQEKEKERTENPWYPPPDADAPGSAGNHGHGVCGSGRRYAGQSGRAKCRISTVSWSWTSRPAVSSAKQRETLLQRLQRAAQ